MPTTFYSPDERGGWLTRELAEPGEETPPPPKPALYVGLDLGKVRDYTALSITEQWPLPDDEHEYRIRHLERLPLNTSYIAQVKHVAALMRRPELEGATLVIDHGGVGGPVYDSFVDAGLKPYGVSIHGGDQVSENGWRQFGVPKRDLVAVTQILLQSQRLKIAAALPDAATLTAELEAFEIKISQAGHDSYNAREGQHDDLVLAVAIGLWAADYGLPRKTWVV